MRKRLRLVLLFFILLIIIGIIYIIKKSNNTNNSSVESSYMYERESIFRVFNEDSAKKMIHEMFIDDTKWNSDMYPISKHFKDKYKTKYDINKDFTDKNSIGANIECVKESGIRIRVSCGLKDKSIDKNFTRYYYDCIVDKNGELYDLEYKYKVPYVYVVDEYWGEGYERADGKSEAKTESAALGLIKFMINPHAVNPFGQCYDEDMTEENLPLADNCRIINRPNMSELGVPNNMGTYWYGIDAQSEIDDYTQIYSKDGFPYLIVEFDDFTKKYEVKYHVNDENFFDYIEFVEVKN